MLERARDGVRGDERKSVPKAFKAKRGWILRCVSSGYEVGLDVSNNTVNKKIREAQLQQWNYLLVVGEKERADKTVTVRDRADPEHQKVLSMEDLLTLFEKQGMPNSRKTLTLDAWKKSQQ
uniref:Threonyl-tRNA synthetase family protein n=1 Tax=Toxoplasma gondii TgCATBr9 TaxID=943120 RepID=A0A2T6IED7_TOXGO|nr:threonyl-tRNA synthetase family protein [Toxoplasma gondii TgCATBr9]